MLYIHWFVSSRLRRKRLTCDSILGKLTFVSHFISVPVAGGWPEMGRGECSFISDRRVSIFIVTVRAGFLDVGTQTY